MYIGLYSVRSTNSDLAHIIPSFRESKYVLVMAAAAPQSVNFEEVSKAFTQHFYMTFDTNREGLASLYTDQSLMTYEGTQIMGQAAIMNKYRSLGFNQAKHNIKTQDAHPNPLQPNAVIVFVTGDLQIEGQEYPMKFAEVFHLVQTGGMCRPVMSFIHIYIFCFLGIQGPTNDTTKHAHNHRYFFHISSFFHHREPHLPS